MAKFARQSAPTAESEAPELPPIQTGPELVPPIPTTAVVKPRRGRPPGSGAFKSRPRTRRRTQVNAKVGRAIQVVTGNAVPAAIAIGAGWSRPPLDAFAAITEAMPGMPQAGQYPVADLYGQAFKNFVAYGQAKYDPKARGLLIRALQYGCLMLETRG